MDKKMVQEWQAGWAAVAAVEQQEHQMATVTSRWRKFKSIIRLAAALGLQKTRHDDEVEAVRERWKKIKELY